MKNSVDVDAQLLVEEFRSIANQLTFQLAVAGARIVALERENDTLKGKKEIPSSGHTSS